MRVVRLILVWLDAEDPKEDRLTVDVVVNDANMVQKNIATLGWIGGASRNTPQLLPFLLRTNGEMDFGYDPEWEDYTEEDRFANINIHGKTANIGEVVTYTHDGEEYTYRIAQVLPVVGT